MTHLPQPVIAAIRGYCIGAGVELALMADVRVAERSTTFALPEAQLGIAADIGGDLRLVREVGAGWARRLLFTGDDFDAELAARIGLVQDLVDDGELDDFVWSLAERMALNAPLAVQAAKRQVNFVAEMGMYEALRFEAASAAMNFVTEDQPRGFAARSARQQPRFSGF